MLFKRRPWREELEIVDRTMKAVSGITDPEEMVETYWNGIHDLMPVDNYLAVSRRGVEPPEYLITRSSRFTENYNPWTQREKLPRLSGGLLGEIAYGNKPVYIEDLAGRLAADDPAFAYLLGFQSLVVLPQYDNGQSLNVSFSLFEEGEKFDETMLPMMHWQAGLFGRGTQNLVLRNQLTGALAALDREMQVVGEIQRSLLPRELPELRGFEMAASYQTSARAGGDAYDFFQLDEHEWGIFIADVSGHGTPAAVLMAVTHAIAHTRPGMPKPPSEMLKHLNHHLTKSYTASGAFVTAFYATVDLRNRRLTYSTAGHNPPRLLRGDRVIALDEGGGLPLGIEGAEKYGETSIGLEKGDLLLLYTDGIPEAMTPMDAMGRRELFGVERVDAVLREYAARGAEACVSGMREAVAEFTRGAAATDDQTLIAVRCVG